MINVANNVMAGLYCRKKMCAVLAINVANAFNLAKWNKIIETLRKRNVPEYLTGVIRNYLSDWWLEYGVPNFMPGYTRVCARVILVDDHIVLR